MLLNSGHYKHKIEICKDVPTGETNIYGEPELETQVIKTLFADFQSKSGSMLYGRPADSKLSKTTHKIEYRYKSFPKLDETYFIKYRGKRYNIEYTDNRNQQNEVMDVFVVAQGTDADL